VKVLKYVLTGVIALGFIANPVVLNAAESEEVANACKQGEFDAQRDVNGTLWLAIGFFGGIFGVAAAYLIEPTPPASRLLGKSPEYIQAYTDCYTSAAKSIQTKKAITGCVVSGLVVVAWEVLWWLVWAGSAATAY
jgi:hypothetical protein